MKILHLLLTHLFLVGVLLSNQSGFAASDNNLAVSVQKAVDQYIKGWNMMSGEEFAKPFAEGSHFVNIFGMHFKGRSENAKRHQFIFDRFLKGTKLHVERMDIDQVDAKVAVVHLVWNLKDFQSSYCQKNSTENSLKCPRRGVFNHVFVKKEGSWKIVETQNTLIIDPRKNS